MWLLSGVQICYILDLLLRLMSNEVVAAESIKGPQKRKGNGGEQFV